MVITINMQPSAKVLGLVRLVIIAVALNYFAYIYMPLIYVPDKVSIRCDKLCKTNGTSHFKAPPPLVHTNDVDSSNSTQKESRYLNSMNLVKQSAPVSHSNVDALAMTCISLCVFSLHALVPLLLFRQGASVLPGKTQFTTFACTTLDVIAAAFVLSLLPYYALPDHGTWASVIGVMTLAAFVIAKPYLGGPKRFNQMSKYPLCKTVKLLLIVLISYALTIIAADVIGIMVGHQREHFAQVCLGDATCPLELYRTCSLNQKGYASVKCTSSAALWLPALRTLPDKMSCNVAFLLGSTSLYAKLFGNRFTLAFWLILQYGIALGSVYFIGAGAEFGAFGAGFFVGLLCGWFAAHWGLSAMIDPPQGLPIHLDGNDRRASREPVYPGAPCVPPTYEMAMAEYDPTSGVTNDLMSRTSAFNIARGVIV